MQSNRVIFYPSLENISSVLCGEKLGMKKHRKAQHSRFFLLQKGLKGFKKLLVWLKPCPWHKRNCTEPTGKAWPLERKGLQSPRGDLGHSLHTNALKLVGFGNFWRDEGIADCQVGFGLCAPTLGAHTGCRVAFLMWLTHGHDPQHQPNPAQEKTKQEGKSNVSFLTLQLHGKWVNNGLLTGY